MPTDKMELMALADDLREPMAAWSFNVMLECSGRDESDMLIAVGGAFLDLRDLNRILKWAYLLATTHPAPASNTTSEGEKAEASTLPGYAWQDMGSAPKDGTWFVALQNGETYPCAWETEGPDEGPPLEGWYDFLNRSFEEPEKWVSATPPTTPAVESAALAAIRSGSE